MLRRRARFVILTLFLSLALSIQWILAPAAVAQAAEMTTMSCPTIMDSLHKDWRATQDLMARYGPSAELNPVIRTMGADPYFGVWTLGMAALCKENQQWQFISFIVWLTETWAVNTHYATGTVQGFPLLMVQIDLGSGSVQNRDSSRADRLSTRKIPRKQIESKSLPGWYLTQKS